MLRPQALETGAYISIHQGYVPVIPRQSAQIYEGKARPLSRRSKVVFKTAR